MSDDDVMIDLGAFDPKTIVERLRGASETLGIPPNEVKSTHLSFEPAEDPTAPGALQIAIYVSSEFGSGGYIELAGDGTVKRISYPS
jgi:hypothetical protein